jgi:hypothetical protein
LGRLPLSSAHSPFSSCAAQPNHSHAGTIYSLGTRLILSSPFMCAQTQLPPTVMWAMTVRSILPTEISLARYKLAPGKPSDGLGAWRTRPLLTVPLAIYIGRPCLHSMVSSSLIHTSPSSHLLLSMLLAVIVQPSSGSFGFHSKSTGGRTHCLPGTRSHDAHAEGRVSPRSTQSATITESQKGWRSPSLFSVLVAVRIRENGPGVRHDAPHAPVASIRVEASRSVMNRSPELGFPPWSCSLVYGALLGAIYGENLLRAFVVDPSSCSTVLCGVLPLVWLGGHRRWRSTVGVLCAAAERAG